MNAQDLGGTSRDAVAVDASQAERSSTRVPVIEESFDVDKVEVDQGGFRVTKHVEVREEQVDELLRHERVTVERVPIGRRLTEGERPESRYEGDTLVIPVVEEVVVTETRLMLVEEVRVSRLQGTHRDARTVTLRKERIEIERLGAESSVIRSSSAPSDRQT